MAYTLADSSYTVNLNPTFQTKESNKTYSYESKTKSKIQYFYKLGDVDLFKIKMEFVSLPDRNMIKDWHGCGQQLTLVFDSSSYQVIIANKKSALKSLSAPYGDHFEGTLECEVIA